MEPRVLVSLVSLVVSAVALSVALSGWMNSR